MPELSRKDLKQKINKGQFDNIYLVFGDEKMYVRIDTDYLVTKLMGKNPSEFNFHSFTFPCSLDDIAVAVQVVPFTDEYNCVKIADMDMNALKKDELDQLEAILKNIPDTTVLIFTMPTLEQDMKKQGAAFSKIKNYIKKNGVICFEQKETDISLARQIIKWADSRGIKIERADAYKLQEYAGDDLHTIKNELDKLCSYVGDGAQITGEHIDLLVPKRLEANIYYLADAIVSENSDRAYTMLDALYYQKAEPESIVNVLSRAYIDFYRARIGSECGVPIKDIASEFGYGKREFVLKKALPKIKKMPTSALRESIDVITQTIAEFHSTVSNKKLSLDKLTAKLILLAGER
ncbi:MAG: DNA polymerase III subunit delta [Ruminococcus sp.]|nr:DNA polymerase III subunit delta [Ruminococcus sp.]